MSSVKKIEEMLEGVEKKVHAGEWVRIEQVRILMNKFAIWMIEEHKKDLRDIKRDILFRGEEEE